jgi:hypothetical protein
MYVFINPKSTKFNEDSKHEINWEFAQKEIAEAKGFGSNKNGKLTAGNLILYKINNFKKLFCF